MIDKSTCKNVLPQVAAAILGTLIVISDGMAYGWTSPMVPYFLSNQTHINISKSDGEFMETINLVGALVSLPFIILEVEYFGRKISLIFCAMLGCACWVTLLFTESLGWIFTARFFLGTAGDMCYVVAPMYIAEIADYRIRGFLSALIYLKMLIGIIIVYSVGALASYQVVSYIGIFLNAIQLIFFSFMPESPYFLVYKNKTEKARKSLLRLKVEPNIDREIEELEKVVERHKNEKGRPQDLILIPSNRYALLIMLILNTSQHFVGITVILMNLHLILNEAGSIYIQPETAAIIFAVIMLISCTIASLLLDRFGRKILLITSGILTGLALLVMSVYFHLKNSEYDVIFVSWIPAVCVMVYAFTFKSGLGLVPIVAAAEIFPATIKAIGTTFAHVVYMTAAILSVVVYSHLYEHFGIHVPFYIFSACSFVAVLFAIFFIPETKGKTLDEIQLILKGTKLTKYAKQNRDLKTTL